MRRFGLIGFPLTHSFSPAYFQNKFQKEGLTDCRYEAFPLASIELLPELLAQHPDLCGFNVTIPYKEQIIPYLDEVDEAAREIRAVNCVKIQRNTDKNDNCQLSTINCQLIEKDYRLKGYNTDAPAFEHCLKEGWQLPDKALVFGTGGAAKAVAYALHRLHIDFYFVSRNKVNEQTITYRDLEHPSKIHNVHNNNLLDNKNLLKDYKLWINTTPVGMYPHTEESLPLDFSVIGSEHYLFDLIYNPEETVFMRQGWGKGAHIKNGLNMLYQQAELSWEIFKGQ